MGRSANNNGADVKEFKPYDKVWTMVDNAPAEMTVFARIESMDHAKTGVEIKYQLVRDKCGAGWGNNEGMQRGEEDVFETKAELAKAVFS